MTRPFIYKKGCKRNGVLCPICKEIHKDITKNKHCHWKGKKVGYNALHGFIKRYKQKSKVCEKCHEKKLLHLCNISGKYKRDINDFKWLCAKCHHTFDDKDKKRTNRLKEWVKVHHPPFEGFKHSKEWKKLHSIGKNNPFYGKHHTNKTKKLMSKTRKGKPFRGNQYVKF